MTYGSPEKPLTCLTDIRALPSGVFDCVDGDGVVPAMSARNPGLPVTDRAAFPAGHKPLLDFPAVGEQVVQWLKEGREVETLKRARQEAMVAVEVGEDAGWVVLARAGDEGDCDVAVGDGGSN